MKDRDIVILVLCVLGGYLVLQALNHGFSFKLDLIEGLGGTCGFPEKAEELNPLVKGVPGVSDSYNKDKVNKLHTKCHGQKNKHDCLGKEIFDDPGNLAWKQGQFLLKLRKNNVQGKCNDQEGALDGDEFSDPIPCDVKGTCYGTKCISRGCVWTPGSGGDHGGHHGDAHPQTGEGGGSGGSGSGKDAICKPGKSSTGEKCFNFNQVTGTYYQNCNDRCCDKNPLCHARYVATCLTGKKKCTELKELPAGEIKELHQGDPKAKKRGFYTSLENCRSGAKGGGTPDAKWCAGSSSQDAAGGPIAKTSPKQRLLTLEKTLKGTGIVGASNKSWQCFSDGCLGVGAQQGAPLNPYAFPAKSKCEQYYAAAVSAGVPCPK